jgi:hypothetical protein
VSVALPRRPAPCAVESPAAAAVEACSDLRCGCGSLLARRVAGGVELKCRRCKRTVVLTFTEDDGS